MRAKRRGTGLQPVRRCRNSSRSFFPLRRHSGIGVPLAARVETLCSIAPAAGFTFDAIAMKDEWRAMSA
jgi:hypothetical protein